MNRFKILLLVALLLSSTNAFAWGAGPLTQHPYDKISHAALSAATTGLGYYFLKEKVGLGEWESRLAAGVVSFAIIGVGKELSDQNFDYADLGATAAGTVVGFGLTFAF